MKRQNSQFAIWGALAVAIGITLFTATESEEPVEVCKDGHMRAYILASPVDGNALVKSNGKIIGLSAGYDGHKNIADVANLSDFKFFLVPLRIESACRLIVRNDVFHLEIDDVRRLIPVSDSETFNGIYADFGIEPVELPPQYPPHPYR